MILGVQTTNKGYTSALLYDGSNGDITFFESFILTRATRYATMSSLVSFISENYPYSMTPDAIVATCQKLERRGLLTITREISKTTPVKLIVAGESSMWVIKASLGSLENNAQFSMETVIQDLSDKGISYLPDLTIRLS